MSALCCSEPSAALRTAQQRVRTLAGHGGWYGWKPECSMAAVAMQGCSARPAHSGACNCCAVLCRCARRPAKGSTLCFGLAGVRGLRYAQQAAEHSSSVQSLGWGWAAVLKCQNVHCTTLWSILVEPLLHVILSLWLSVLLLYACYGLLQAPCIDLTIWFVLLSSRRCASTSCWCPPFIPLARVFYGTICACCALALLRRA